MRKSWTLATGETLPGIDHVVPSIRELEVRTHQRGGHDGTGVDHRVMREVTFVQHTGIEISTRGLTANMLVYFIFAVVF